MIEKHFVMCSLVILLLAFSASAQEWQIQDVHGVKSASVKAMGDTPDGPRETYLILNNPQGRARDIYFLYQIRRGYELKRFDFNPFQGPWAPARHRKLITLEVRTKRRFVVLNTSSEGIVPACIPFPCDFKGLPIESGHFEIEFNGYHIPRWKIMKALDAIMEGAESIIVTVRDYHGSRRVVRTVFPAANAAACVSELLNRK